MEDEMAVGLQEEIIADLVTELSGEPTFDITMLTQKVVNAIKDVKRARKYPSYYTDEQIKYDLYEFYSNIRSIALYDYNQIGSEGESSHSENGISRSYVDRSKLFSGIIPIARI